MQKQIVCNLQAKLKTTISNGKYYESLKETQPQNKRPNKK